MKKSIVIAMSSVMLFASCNSYTGAGAYTGSQLGSILGSAIGGITGGWRGSNVGQIVGMAGGAAVGAAIGNAADKQHQREVQERHEEMTARRHARLEQQSRANQNSSSYDNGQYQSPSTDSGYDPNNSGDDRIYDFNSSDYTGSYSAQQPTTVTPMQSSVDNLAEGLNYAPNIEIRNARFVDDNENGTIERGELSKVIFEIYNNGDQTIYDVQPAVLEATGNKHIYVSPGIHVEKIAPGRGIRYTAMVKADNRLKDGNARICVSVLQGNKSISKVSEFNIPTRKK